jgi:hypothetical protein
MKQLQVLMTRLIVVLDQHGKPDFDDLQHYTGLSDSVYYIFDLQYFH